MTSQRVQEKGFTLIEVMITMAVMSLVLVGVLLSNSVVQQSGEAAYQRSLAMQDASKVMEQMRKSAQAAEEFPADLIEDFPEGTVEGYTALTDETVSVTYADTEADPLDTTVSVTWKENGTREESVTLRALLTQR